MRLNPLRKIAIKYGIICGIMMIVSFSIQNYLGLNPIITLRSFFVELVLFFGFIFFAVKEFKEYKNGGFLHFWQGISIGMIIIFVSNVIFSVFSATYYLINETAFQDYVADTLNILEIKKDELLKHGSIEQFEKQKIELGKTTVGDLVLDRFIKKSGLGFLMTPMVAMLLRRQNSLNEKE